MSTPTYRGDKRREVRRRNILVRHEEERQQLARLARRFQAIAGGREVADDAPLGASAASRVAAQRGARLLIGLLLLLESPVFLAVALEVPAALPAAFLSGWALSFVIWALLRSTQARRAPRDPAVDHATARRIAAASTFLPIAGAALGVAVPLSWLLSGFTGAPIAVLLGGAVVTGVYVVLRSEVAEEQEILAAGDEAPALRGGE